MALIDYFSHLPDAYPKRNTEAIQGDVSCIDVSGVDVVRKAWGQERWLVGENAPWGFKLIYVKSGQRTSLHYHVQKEEACLILSGEAELHYSESRDGDRRHIRVGEGNIVHIRPNCLHRFEGLSDMVMVEVSTAHLDDVIRVEDDWNRPDGRIASEREARPSM